MEEAGRDSLTKRSPTPVDGAGPAKFECNAKDGLQEAEEPPFSPSSLTLEAPGDLLLL